MSGKEVIRETVKIELFMGKTEDSTYEGRFVGTVDKWGFSTLIREAANRKKVFTAETVPFSKLSELLTKLSMPNAADQIPKAKEVRLVFSTNTRNGKIYSRHLLITAPISHASHQKADSVGIETQDKGYLIVELINE